MNHWRFPLKKFKNVCGIYVAIHRDSGMVYVGSSVNIHTRIMAHVFSAGRGSELPFHKALQEFGFHSFDFECVKECPREELIGWERIHIALLNAASTSGFNVTSSPARITTYGKARSSATRQRISAKLKGKKFSPSRIQNLRLSHIGNRPSKETRDKMSKSRMGIKPSQRAIDSLISRSKGRIVSDETKKRLRESHLGHRHSPESKAKMSLAMTAIRAEKKW